ncbi:MAG TPA: lipid-binding SYLF domain-containing protein [Verrucomicrobiae bacterium]|nr:lipid-binding SYLF domain-containing protein [Verrucomicrobiae bacterium]
MKIIALGLIMLGFANAAFAADKAELDNRMQTLTAKLDAMQQKPDKAVPADALRKAQGIILLDRTKAGFIFAYEGGNGVAMVKNPKSEKWSPIAFVAANEASLGFQVGGEQSFYVILLMNTNATRLLTDGNMVDFSGEARGTAGTNSAGAEGKISPDNQPFLVYGDRKGLYGGAAIKGGAISPDDQANRVYYDQYLTMREILFEQKVQPTEAASALARKLADYSKPRTYSKNSGN